MKISTLKSGNLQVKISDLGAEMVSLLFKNKEFLYQKEKGFWQRQSPVLFPIVGALRDGKYIFEDTKYFLSQHGFTRDMVFDCVHQSKDKITFVLKNNTDTLQKYPFCFELQISYKIQEDKLQVEYEVKNTGDTTMYFSLGGHPAFKIGTDINLYLLDFGKDKEKLKIDRLESGLLDGNLQEDILLLDGKLSLSEKLFEKDAIICRNMDLKKVVLFENNERLFSFKMQNFSHLGIWKQLGAGFLCIEPWIGYANRKDRKNYNLSEKDAIVSLDVGKQEQYSWGIEF